MSTPALVLVGLIIVLLVDPARRSASARLVARRRSCSSSATARATDALAGPSAAGPDASPSPRSSRSIGPDTAATSSGVVSGPAARIAAVDAVGVRRRSSPRTSRASRRPPRRRRPGRPTSRADRGTRPARRDRERDLDPEDRVEPRRRRRRAAASAARTIARVWSMFIRSPVPYGPPVQPVFTSQTGTSCARAAPSASSRTRPDGAA